MVFPGLPGELVEEDELLAAAVAVDIVVRNLAAPPSVNRNRSAQLVLGEELSSIDCRLLIENYHFPLYLIAVVDDPWAHPISQMQISQK
jgi:hypothetical protein